MSWELDEPWRTRVELTRNYLGLEGAVGVLVFGSLARNAGDRAHDLDVIFLLTLKRPQRLVAYIPWSNPEFDADVNVLCIDELNTRLFDPAWQYRLIDARYVGEPPSRRYVDWLDRVRQWVGSEEARAHRVEVLREQLSGRITGLEHCRLPAITASVAYARLLKIVLLLEAELQGRQPFSKGNPLATASDAQRVAGILEMWPASLASGITASASDPQYRARWKAVDYPLALVASQGPLGESSGREAADSAEETDGSCGHAASTIETQARGIPKWPRPFISLVLDVAKELVSRTRQTRCLDITYARSRPPSMRRLAQPRLSALASDGKRFKIIVPTGGCRVPSCTFCSLPRLAAAQSPPHWKLLIPEEASGVEEVAIYTDGSFFDSRELAPEMRLAALHRLGELGVKRLMVESLPRFLTDDALSVFYRAMPTGLDLVVAVGLQSADDGIRRYCLATPISTHDMSALFEVRRRFGFGLRLYLMAGKPLLTPEEDLSDIESSVAAVSDSLRVGDVVTVNRLLPSAHTLVAGLVAVGLYELVSLCRLRQTIDHLRQAYRHLVVRPGCISRQTCAEEISPPVIECAQCFGWLSALEAGREPLPLRCGSRRLSFGALAWPVLGGVARRRRYAELLLRSTVSMQGTPSC